MNINWKKNLIIFIGAVIIVYLAIFGVLLGINKGDLKKDVNIIPKSNTENVIKKENVVKQDVVSGFDLNKTYSSPFSPKFGNPKSKVSVVMFIDFDCVYCNSEYESLKKIMTEYKDYGYFEFRNMPIDTLHPNTRLLSNASMCANAQNKFWEMFDEIFSNFDSRKEISDDTELMKTIYNYGKDIGLNMDDFSKCYDEKRFDKIIDKDFIDGVSYGVDSTPTFFINGNKVPGAITYENWESFFQLSIEKNR